MVSSEAKQKAPATIRKQESMWKNHVQPAFGDKEINSFKITDLNDFLYDLYGKQGKSYAYTEGFLKFFYLLFGYAYRLELFNENKYFRMFGDSKTRLSMPTKEQADVEDDLEGAEIYMARNSIEYEKYRYTYVSKINAVLVKWLAPNMKTICHIYL